MTDQANIPPLCSGHPIHSPWPVRSTDETVPPAAAKALPSASQDYVGGAAKVDGDHGGMLAASPTLPLLSTSRAQQDLPLEEPVLFGPEPLVAAAGPLVQLARSFKTVNAAPDINHVRHLAMRALDAFSIRAQRLRLENGSIQLAHYILCAFLDDAVMATTWGANSPWSHFSLLAAYHNDVQGGERLFQFAERMQQQPDREPRLVELLYLCLSLGFEGRAALDPRGSNLLAQHRAGLAAIIKQQRGAMPDELSPQWKGIVAPPVPYTPRIPLQRIVAGLALTGLAVFAILLCCLRSESSSALAALNRSVRSVPSTGKFPSLSIIRSILAPDVAMGRLALLHENSDLVIRLVNQGLFEAGSAVPADAWRNTFGRLAQVANHTHGDIRVEGHTDSRKIHSSAFPSNLALSQARSAAVARALLDAGLQDGRRLRATGYGDTQPIGNNDTIDGRRENRRVEIRVADDAVWR